MAASIRGATFGFAKRLNKYGQYQPQNRSSLNKQTASTVSATQRTLAHSVFSTTFALSYAQTSQVLQTQQQADAVAEAIAGLKKINLSV